MNLQALITRTEADLQAAIRGHRGYDVAGLEMKLAELRRQNERPYVEPLAVSIEEAPPPPPPMPKEPKPRKCRICNRWRAGEMFTKHPRVCGSCESEIV